MGDGPQLPNDEIMRLMAKMAMEKATTHFAGVAERMAKTLPSDISGHDALMAFAEAIRSTNAAAYPSEPPHG